MDNEIIQNRISQLREEMKKTKFDYLYRKYKNTPLSSYERHEIFEELVRIAKSFDDWDIVGRYGDNSYQYLAEEHMRAKVLEGKTSSEVRRNITKLFSIVTDEDEQNEILKAFLSKYNSRDDLLFAWDYSPCLVMELFDMPIEEIEEITSEKEKQLIMSC